MIEEISEEPSYLKVVYNKDSYQSIKLNNLRFDFDFILSLLSNAGGVKKLDRWAIIMVILTVLTQLTKCKIELSPDMGKVITFLYENGYQSKLGKSISEDELWKEMQRKCSSENGVLSDSAQLYDCINKLKNLKAIELVEGKVSLKEELKINRRHGYLTQHKPGCYGKSFH